MSVILWKNTISWLSNMHFPNYCHVISTCTSWAAGLDSVICVCSLEIILGETFQNNEEYVDDLSSLVLVAASSCMKLLGMCGRVKGCPLMVYLIYDGATLVFIPAACPIV